MCKPTPTGIDRIDLVYARFLIRSRWIDLRPVYVKGNYVHPVTTGKLRMVVDSLCRIWAGKESPSEARGVLANSPKGKLLRLLIRKFHQHEKPLKTGYYVNVSQRNLAQPAVIKWMERRVNASLCVIHDLLPLTHSQFFDEAAGALHEEKIRALMSVDALMVCGSRSFSLELAEFATRCGYPHARTIHAAFGCKRPSRANPDEAVRFTKPFFLVLGTFEPRKNHRFLLNVWIELIQRYGSENAPQLVMAGRYGGESETIAKFLATEAMLAAKVTILDGVTDIQISSLMRSARAVLMPSVVEGYGLPFYESFAHGTPVISSDLPVFEELSQSIAQLIPINDLDAWVQAIECFVVSGERLRQVKMLSHWRRPTWAYHFRQIIAFAKQQEGSSGPLEDRVNQRTHD